MTTWFVEWELTDQFDASRAKERIRTARESTRVRGWGVFVGLRKGFTILETNSDLEITQILYRLAQTGFHVTSNTPMLGLDEYDKLVGQLGMGGSQR